MKENKKNFEQCLDIGGRTEILLAKLFLENGFVAFMASPKALYDFGIYKSRPDLVEAKNEDAFSDSGNICIELYQGGDKHPSGLKISESTIYIHKLGKKVIIYKTQEMRNYIAKNWKFLKPEIKDFPKADNKNGGLIRPINELKDFWWFDYCDLENITKSKLFKEDS